MLTPKSIPNIGLYNNPSLATYPPSGLSLQFNQAYPLQSLLRLHSHRHDACCVAKTEIAGRSGELVSAHVIARPDPSVLKLYT